MTKSELNLIDNYILFCDDFYYSHHRSTENPNFEDYEKLRDGVSKIAEKESSRQLNRAIKQKAKQIMRNKSKMKNLILILAILTFQSCISFETEINLNEIETEKKSEIVEVEFNLSENTVWSTKEPFLQEVSESVLFQQLATDGRNLFVELKNYQFVRTHSLFIDNCDSSWFSVYYYDLRTLEFFLNGNCYLSTLDNTGKIIFTIEIEI